jgi:hypothetical protein
MNARLLVFLLVLLNACQKEEIMPDDDLFHTWEAKSFISVESAMYKKTEENPILLTFNKDGTYRVKLDINSGVGKFEKDTSQWINLTFPACTEACCDSPFSYKLSNMLPKVTSYKITEENLYLDVPGWGYIKLELVD